MKIKRLLILIIVLFLTGCSTKYTLIVSNDSIKENIDIVIPKDMIPKLSDEEKKLGLELDDQITPFVEQDQYPIYDNYNIIYSKGKEESDKYIKLKLDYTFKPEEFIKANSLARCFSNYAYSYEENYIFKASGDFYCLYSDKVEITIHAKNRVIKSNADSKKGRTHTWYITRNNPEDVDIDIEIARGFSIALIIPYVIIFVVVLILVFGIMFIKKRKEINKF